MSVRTAEYYKLRAEKLKAKDPVVNANLIRKALRNFRRLSNSK